MEDSLQLMDTEENDCTLTFPQVSNVDCSRPPKKISTVIPCFKKKPAQKILNPKTIEALGPIITTLLGSGTLNEIFISNEQTGNTSNLCEPLVQKTLGIDQHPQNNALISANSSLSPVTEHTTPVHASQALGDQSSVLESTEPTFPSEGTSGTDPNTANSSFQDLLLEIHSSDKILESYPSGLFKETSYMDQYNVSQIHPSNSGIFEDKSEEASLHLLLELVTQLQYHVHQQDGVDICIDFLQGLCCYGKDCLKHHTVLPYHWQLKRRDTGKWQNVNDESQEHIERLYCSPDIERIRMRNQGDYFSVNLDSMTVYESYEFDQIRRLSTPSSTSGSNLIHHTVWKYYCRDHFGWREYSENVVKLLDNAKSHGLVEVRFSLWNKLYVVNIRDGFQQNASFRKEIKIRPMFQSSVLLLPYLQTLNGKDPVSPVWTDPAASSLVLSPASITNPNFYPETWITMDSLQEFVQVPMPKEDKSYRTVYSLFHKTIPETKFRILKIMRVQNLFLWEKYKRKKEFMIRKMSGLQRIVNERHLFHGTSPEVVDGICKHNFDPRVCGKHATMFGQGSYFARKSSYSHNFSKKSLRGVHYMFLAKVLTGRFIVGNHTMRRPPPLNPGDVTSDLYDSCVDNFFDPQIFVIFNDDQSYPYFIIQYEEVSNTVSV